MPFAPTALKERESGHREKSFSFKDNTQSFISQLAPTLIDKIRIGFINSMA